jgi:hypothetical protein
MAESQVPYPNLPVQVAAIRASLSEPRFSTYLAKGGGDEGYALALYLYNARVAKAFMYPLSVVEVTLRNAIDALLEARHGAAWHLDPNFRNNVLTHDGLSTLSKAIQRAGQGAARSSVVAELTFDFWSNLLRPEYGNFWRTGLNIVFPNLIRGTTRHDIQSMARAINLFRNRVAHHEPVLDLNITDVYAKIVELVGLRCQETAAWLKHHSTLSAMIRTRPRGPAAGFVTLSDRIAPDFIAVNISTTLEDVARQFDRQHQVVVCFDNEGIILGAFGALDLIRFLAEDTKANGGLTAPREQSVGALLADPAFAPSWMAMAENAPVADAVTQLTGKAVNIVVAVKASGAVAGVITRALRRY